MKVIGLTGGIGCGKSTVTRYLSELGVPIVDADLISRQVAEPGNPAFEQIVEAFGSGILDESGKLDRQALAKIVFSKKEALAKLEAIIHPAVRREILSQIDHYKKQGANYIIADIPLLLEKNYHDVVDLIAVVDCLPHQQIERVKNRDGRSESDIQNIMDKQISREKRLANADVVLDNTANSPEPLLEQVQQNHSIWSIKILD